MTQKLQTLARQMIFGSRRNTDLAINNLSDAERIELRIYLAASGVREFPKNLFFNYTTQKWIEGSDWPKN